MTAALATPTLLIIIAALIFLTLERVRPGRELPNAPGWYGRALLVNAGQIAITFSTATLWTQLFGASSLFKLSALQLPLVEGFVGWFVGTFFFYWWHRVRHIDGWWQLFHQVHHSPARIEAITSFYKHPLEILADSALAAAVMYPLLGCSLEGALWFNFFAATGEFFYHSNFKSPPWLKYIIQTPELHSVHHELDVHRYNFADLPLWDRLFGTYRGTDDFAPACGFPNHNEQHLGKMLLFQDVYNDGGERQFAQNADPSSLSLRSSCAGHAPPSKTDRATRSPSGRSVVESLTNRL